MNNKWNFAAVYYNSLDKKIIQKFLKPVMRFGLGL